MMKTRKTICNLSILLCFGLGTFAQEPPDDFDRASFFSVQEFSDTPANVQVRSERSEGNVITQEIYFSGGSFNGKPTRIHAFYSRPNTPGPHPGVVELHGAGLKTLKAHPSIFFAQQGFACISIDWWGRGHGRSEPRSEVESPGVMAGPLPDAQKSEAPPHGWRSYGREVDQIRAGVQLARRAVRFLQDRPEVNNDALCLSGVSAGAHLSLLILGVEPAFQVATMKYGCGYIAELGLGGYFFPISLVSPQEQRDWLSAFDPQHGLANINAKTLLLSGTGRFLFLDARGFGDASRDPHRQTPGDGAKR